MNQVLRHRLRNLASGIKSAVSFLSRELEDRLKPEEMEYFPLILKECDSITGITSRFNLLFDYVAPGEQKTVESAIRTVISSVRERFPTAMIQVVLQNDTAASRVRSGQFLELALEELLVNACEAGPQHPVYLNSLEEDGQLKLEVLDQGSGLKDTSLEEILGLFYTTKTRHLGVGLNIADRLLKQLGGSLGGEERKEGGLAMAMTIPRVQNTLVEEDAGIFGVTTPTPTSTVS